MALIQALGAVIHILALAIPPTLAMGSVALLIFTWLKPLTWWAEDVDSGRHLQGSRAWVKEIQGVRLQVSMWLVIVLIIALVGIYTYQIYPPTVGNWLHSL